MRMHVDSMTEHTFPSYAEKPVDHGDQPAFTEKGAGSGVPSEGRFPVSLLQPEKIREERGKLRKQDDDDKGEERGEDQRQR